jgi:hypothetical protein
MDMFNIKRRDNPSLDRWTNLKKPAFGGPSEKEDFDKSKRKSLDGYQRIVERDPNAEGGRFNPNYDSAWKGFSSDIVYRTAKKKPYTQMYAKPTIATVEAVEEGKIARYEEFVNENYGYEFNEAEEPLENDENVELGYEVDEELLEQLTEEFGDDLQEMIDNICEKMELEKEEVCDLLCAAIEKMCKTEEEEEDSEKMADESKKPLEDEEQNEEV